VKRADDGSLAWVEGESFLWSSIRSRGNDVNSPMEGNWALGKINDDASAQQVHKQEDLKLHMFTVLVQRFI
jgi:hypothetical protein